MGDGFDNEKVNKMPQPPPLFSLSQGMRSTLKWREADIITQQNARERVCVCVIKETIARA